jgi:hypothetical protein
MNACFIFTYDLVRFSERADIYQTDVLTSNVIYARVRSRQGWA